MKKIKFLLIASALLVAFGCNKEEAPSEEGMKPTEEPTVIEEFTVNGVSFKMIKVDGGTFTMGRSTSGNGDSHKDDIPAHQVTLSDYYIGQTEVTQELWETVVGSSDNNENLEKPVGNVSWDNIVNDFLPKLNELTGKTFSLPTEAQWEFAAKGGNKSKGYEYSGSNNLDEVAWHLDNSNGQTHPVGKKLPNELGIYDMSGNVIEWCSDWYGDYSAEAQTNPTGPATGQGRVIRGGSYGDIHYLLHIYSRYVDKPVRKTNHYGFRLALVL